MKRTGAATATSRTTRTSAAYNPDAPLGAAVPHAGALRRAVEGRLRLRLRSRRTTASRCSRGTASSSRKRSSQAYARRRLGVGHRLLDRPAAEVHLPRGRQERAVYDHRSAVARVLTSFGDGGASRACSSPCTASRPTPRATSTRPKPTTAAACSGSSTRGCSHVTKGGEQGTVWPTRSTQ